MEPAEDEENSNRPKKMSERMFQILEDMASGLSTEKSAEIRGLSFFTVKTHRRRVLAHLGARNAAHAVGIAIRKGLLSPWAVVPIQQEDRTDEEKQDPGCAGVLGSGADVQVDPAEEVGEGSVVRGVPDVREGPGSGVGAGPEQEGRNGGLGGDDVRRPGRSVAGVRGPARRSWRYSGDAE